MDIMWAERIRKRGFVQEVAHWCALLFFSCSVMSDSLWPHGLQHARLPCPSPSPRAYSNSCSSSQWYHPTISSCHPFLLLPSNFPSIRVFSNESVFASAGPSIGASALASVLPMNIQSWFPLGLTGLISLLFKRLSKSLLQHHSSKASILWQSSSLDHHKEGWAPKNWCFQPLKVFSLGV